MAPDIAPSRPTGPEIAPSRATAATWVAATGALLLLAAAGTFLAVSWERMGLPARVALVAAITGAAIVGGHRLRRSLPAVGAVVFHLGALLIPLDVLGLALQLDASPAARWIVVGATSVLVLPVLAATGRSIVLGWGAVAGVPALATGVAMATAPIAPLLVAGVALAAVGVAGSTSGVRRELTQTAGVVLAVTVVAAPVLVAVAVAVPATGGALEHLQVAGWEPVSWLLVLGASVVAVAAMAIATHREGSSRLAALTLSSAVVGTLTALLPTAAPDAVLIVAPAAVVLVLELVVVLARADRPWSRPATVLATLAEVVNVVALVPLLGVGLVLARIDYGGDGPRALALLVLAVAWGVAAWRRADGREIRRASVVASATVAVLHLALAAIVGGVGAVPAVAVLLVGATATLVWRPTEDGGVGGAGVTAWVVAVVAATGSGLAALLVAADRPILVGVVLTIAVVAGLHVRVSAAIHDEPAGVATLALSVPLAVLAILVGSAAIAVGPAPTAPWAAVVAIVALLGLASLSAQPIVAHATRGVAALLGVATTSTALSHVLGEDSWVVADVIRLGATSLLPAGVVATWLLVEVARRRQVVLACLAVPAAVRLLASVLLTAGVGPRPSGVVVLTLGAIGALAAAVGLGRSTWPSVVLAGTAATIGVPLIGLTPELRALLVVATGLVVAVSGATRRTAVVAHVGGLVAVAGCWELLSLRGVTAVDVWVLPLAVHLWITGLALRRDQGASSWIADVPPLLLVAIPALVERAAGGGGWHAVLAGGLGVLAVAAGGNARLGGPLVIGTLLLVAVVGIEVFAVVAVVPTWIWLAIGGATLLAAGAAMERMDGTPVTVTRRLVHLVGERFD